MKYIYVLLFLMTFQWGFGQECNATIKTPLGSTIDIFDWRQEKFDFWIKGCGLRQPYSPFWSNGNYNPNVRHLYGPSADDDGSWVRDYRPEDGWELLYKHFGTQAKPAEVPALMLYNRYESNIRLFFYLTPKKAYGGGGRIKMFFQDTIKSALLNYVAQPQKALDNFRKNMVAYMPVKYENGAGGDDCEGYWIFGEIPVAYDPCTCYYPSAFIVSPSLGDPSTITLDITGGGTITQVAAQGSSKVASHTSVLQNLNGVVAKGAKTAKTLQGYYRFIEKLASSYSLISSGPTVGNEGKKKEFGFPKWMKDIPKFGTALGIIEFIVGGGKSSGGAKPKPTSFETDLNFKAIGKTQHSYTSTKVRVPGAKSSPNSLEEGTPVYDNTLGIFTLLETPVALRRPIAGQNVSSGDFNTPFGHRFKIEDELKYVVNPASGLVLEDISFRYVFKRKEKIGLPLSVLNNEINQGVKLDKLVNNESNAKTYFTPYVPLCYLDNYVFDIFETFGSFLLPLDQDFELFLELNVVLEQNSDLGVNPLYSSGASKVFLRHRYEVPVVSTPFPIDDIYELQNIASHITVSNLTLDVDKTIQAWSTVKILGDIVTNGHELTIIAGAEILGNVSNLPSDVDLIIGNPDVGGCELVIEQTATQVKDFCTSYKYEPVAAQNPEAEQQQESNSYLSISPNPFQNYFKVTYRLAEDQEVTGLLYNILGEVVKEVRLMGGDVDNELIVECADFSTGIYFLTIQTESDLKTVKLMKKPE